jgi:hypothetical protein
MNYQKKQNKSQKQNFNQFAIRKECLYFVDPISADLKMFVPEKYREKLFEERHNGPIAIKNWAKLKFVYKEHKINKFYYEPRLNNNIVAIILIPNLYILKLAHLYNPPLPYDMPLRLLAKT